MACRKLEQTLAALTVRDGVAIGAGQADGFGRLKLKGLPVAIARQLDAVTGEASDTPPRPVRVDDADAGAAVIRVEFYCDGPFLIADVSRNKAPVEDAGEDASREPHQRPQRLGPHLPLILGSSLSGALRARAEWLAAVKKIGTDKERVKTLGVGQSLEHPVDRLFGVTGFRGLLAIRSIVVREATSWQVTSVKIDRFSGAPIDNALFATETFIGVRFTANFILEQRGKTAAGADDKTLLEELLKDLKENGLQLGAGGNKGFGWFEAKVISGGANA